MCISVIIEQASQRWARGQSVMGERCLSTTNGEQEEIVAVIDRVYVIAQESKQIGVYLCKSACASKLIVCDSK